jgi:hypothetical protein
LVTSAILYGTSFARHTVVVEGGKVRFKTGLDLGGGKWEEMGWCGAREMLKVRMGPTTVYYIAL